MWYSASTFLYSPGYIKLDLQYKALCSVYVTTSKSYFLSIYSIYCVMYDNEKCL